jgi:glucokinase
MDQVLAAVDIGGTKITVSLINGHGFLAKIRQLTRKTGENKVVPQQILQLLDQACQTARINRKEIKEIGISACGPFAKTSHGFVLKAANLCGGLAKEKKDIPNDWTEIPLEQELKPLFSRLELVNDAISSAVAEKHFGSGKNVDNFVYVTWSTGIGAGAYVDGHLVEGKNKNGTHLGHTFITTSFAGLPQCGCGDYGHVESLVAGPAIARDFGASTAEVFEKYRQGDVKAKQVIENATHILTLGLVNITCILDSELIIMGGSVTKNWDIVYPLIKKTFYTSFPPLTQGVGIIRSELADYIGDLAALSLIMPVAWIKGWQQHRPWENAPITINLDE